MQCQTRIIHVFLRTLASAHAMYLYIIQLNLGSSKAQLVLLLCHACSRIENVEKRAISLLYIVPPPQMWYNVVNVVVYSVVSTLLLDCPCKLSCLYGIGGIFIYSTQYICNENDFFNGLWTRIYHNMNMSLSNYQESYATV